MKGGLKKYGLIFFSLCISLVSCGQSQKNKESAQDSAYVDWNRSIAGSFIGQAKPTFDSVEIYSFFKRYPQLKQVEKDVYTFYRNRDFTYAWFDNGTLIEQAGNLYNRIINLDNEGISRKIPYQGMLDSLLHLWELDSRKKPNISLELMLTAHYYIFAKLSWEGMDQSVSESLNWHLPRKKANYEDYLDSLLNGPVNKVPNEPVYRQYALLKAYLLKYKQLEQQESWAPIKYNRSGSQLGDSSLLITKIKKRLYLLEDYSGDTTNTHFDKELYNALKTFQQRNGLAVDGKIGVETVNTLNIPLRNRIRQIVVNMERNRWLPIAGHTDVLAVNIPDFRLHVFHKDSLLWSCKVVVGQGTHPTTVFFGELQWVVFRPYWNVPESIVKHELLPEMKANTNYLASHDMEITGYRNGLPVVRQKPGPNNSLGLVKFLFPNSYNTYLHDTPAKSLFGESSRAFSHGCIRVEEPVKLANFLLRHQTEWTPEKISSAMQHGKETYVRLKVAVPVFIAYFTAFVGQDQKLNFRKDIYDLDEHLANMIFIAPKRK
ncbi:MAG TPA: L,D-transpeptidase family protein [Pelobium sp.]|nr:L,D-transpeptidase family protein [Pelobium sp.]